MKLRISQERTLAHLASAASVYLLAILLTSGTAFAQSPAESTQTARQFVRDKLAVWQKRLHLEDWRISVELTRKSELKPKTLGGTRWDKHKKTATIWVLDPADYQLPFDEILTDLELTVVHELVHLELASLPRSEASRSSEEHAVNHLAEALVELDKLKK